MVYNNLTRELLKRTAANGLLRDISQLSSKHNRTQQRPYNISDLIEKDQLIDEFQ